MKNPLLARAVAILLLPVGLAAQTASIPPKDVPLRPVEPAMIAQPTPPAFELTAKWNDRMKVQEVKFTNDSTQVLQVLGVQSTGGIFVVDFPQKVAAAKEEKIGFIYHASDNTDGDIELIRLLTDQGIKDLSIKVARDEAVRFDTREVRWMVGDKPDSKAVTLTIAAGTVTPQKVRVSGGHQASLESVDATTWRVKIVPSSTAKSGQFTVVVEFDQPLPGKAAVILGVIQPKE